MSDKLANVSTSKLEAELASVKDALAKAEKDMEDEKASKKMAEDAKCGLATELENLKAKYDEVTAELATVKTDIVKSARLSKLLAAGLSQEDAAAKLETFAGLNDAQFDSIASILASIQKKDETVAEKQTEAEKAEAAEADLKASEEDKDIDATASVDDLSDLAVALASHLEDKLATNKEKK
jgi:chromosome segregation ATPase